MYTEQQLTERVRQGDRGAQRELYQRYAGTAMAVAMRYVADTEAARDVLQEAFVKVFTHFDDFTWRGEGSLRAWVMRVVCNEAIGWLRRERRFAFGSLPPDEPPEEEEPDVGDVSLEVLQRLIEQLPDGYRQVFCLYVFDQQSHKEIARLLGIKESTSASQFLRAKRLLARQINEYKRRQQR